jgi:hypothetical protein
MAALALAAHPEILNSTRDVSRVEKLLALLQTHAKPLGFGDQYEGIGCLRVPNLVSDNAL